MRWTNEKSASRGESTKAREMDDRLLDISHTARKPKTTNGLMRETNGPTPEKTAQTDQKGMPGMCGVINDEMTATGGVCVEDPRGRA